MDSRLLTAEQIYRQDGPAKALPEFERLLQVFRESDDTRNVAISEGYIGALHWRLGNFEQSRLHLDIALQLKRDIGDRLQEGKTLNTLGLLEWDLGNFEQAIERFLEASKIGKETGDRKLEGSALNNLSLVYDELGNYQTSLEQYQQVLNIYSDADFPRGTGDTLGNIGGVYLLLGYFSKAVEYYQQALEISKELESVPSMSQDYGNLGLSYTGTGKIDLALEHFDEAIKLAEAAGMRQEQGLWLRGKANAQIKAGRYDIGLQYHRAALDIYAEVDAQPLLLEALHDMGQLKLSLGDAISAEQYFQRAIKLARSIGLSRAITSNLLALGDLQHRHQRYEAAAALYSRAIERTLEFGEEGSHAEGLLRLAIIHIDQEQFGNAQQEIDLALVIAQKTGATALEAEALYMQAELARISGNPLPALDRYQAADTLSSEVGDPDLLWRIEYGRALALVMSGEKEAAVNALLAAVGQIESVRNRLQEKRYRAGYIQDKHQVYIELVRLQLELGRTTDAFSTAERMRTWSFIEQSGLGETLKLTLARREEKIELRERIRQLQQNLEAEQILLAPERRQLAIDTFSRELLLAEQDYQAFLDDTGEPGAASAAPATRVQDTDMRARLLANEALIEYVVGADNIMIFVMTPDKIRALSTPARQIDLHSRLELLRDLLEERDSEQWKKPAASLSATVLTPVLKKGWLEGVDHLYLVPHDMLNYLPFALLPVQSATEPGLVIDRFTLAYLPSAATLANGASSGNQPQSMLAMAPGRSRLQHASEEVSSITKLFRPHSEMLLGAAATESAFKNNADQFRVLHLATHGYFNKLNPLLSGLQLEPDETNDGLLEVHEILELKLESELVTLSACETGLGSGYFTEIPAGDDFVGVTRAFLQVGSAAVLATLWAVDDRSTVDLMKSFYRNLDAAGTDRDKAAALARAQKTLRASNKYKHPYYWAPFVLVGATNQNPLARIET
jgi:CHAT domain-containing protein/Tfp pilus assembly protein PilF